VKTGEIFNRSTFWHTLGESEETHKNLGSRMISDIKI
jgi:hypothetical protein